MVPCVGRHLGEMRYADDLVALSQGGQFPAQDVSQTAAHVGVDLIEDQRAPVSYTHLTLPTSDLV